MKSVEGDAAEDTAIEKPMLAAGCCCGIKPKPARGGSLAELVGREVDST